MVTCPPVAHTQSTKLTEPQSVLLHCQQFMQAVTINQTQVQRGRGRVRHLLGSCSSPGMMHLCSTVGCARGRHLTKAPCCLTLLAASVWGPLVSVLSAAMFTVHKHSVCESAPSAAQPCLTSPASMKRHHRQQLCLWCSSMLPSARHSSLPAMRLCVLRQQLDLQCFTLPPDTQHMLLGLLALAWNACCLRRASVRLH